MAADGPNENGGAGGREGPDRTRPTQQSLSFEAADGDGSPAAAKAPAWLETMERRGADRPEPPLAPRQEEPGREAVRLDDARSHDTPPNPGVKRTTSLPARRPTPPMAPPPGPGSVEDEGIERLRELARHHARSDASAGIPDPSAEGMTNSEIELRDRCRSFFERWMNARRRETLEQVSGAEERASEKLGRLSLGIDRFQRLTNELVRLKARYSIRKDEVTKELTSEGRERPRGIPTKVYAAALLFLGIVEFFANGPVFSALLPRDPLTERQIRVLTEMSEGWFAGIERVIAHLVFRPDAALLAAGVITFLCVLCHFF